MMLLDITQIGIKYIFKSLSDSGKSNYNDEYILCRNKKNNCMKINIASFYIFLHDRKIISFIHFFHVVKLMFLSIHEYLEVSLRAMFWQLI